MPPGAGPSALQWIGACSPEPVCTAALVAGPICACAAVTVTCAILHVHNERHVDRAHRDVAHGRWPPARPPRSLKVGWLGTLLPAGGSTSDFASCARATPSHLARHVLGGRGRVGGLFGGRRRGWSAALALSGGDRHHRTRRRERDGVHGGCRMLSPDRARGYDDRGRLRHGRAPGSRVRDPGRGLGRGVPDDDRGPHRDRCGTVRWRRTGSEGAPSGREWGLRPGRHRFTRARCHGAAATLCPARRPGSRWPQRLR
jgi:hypothetical protein